MNSRPKMLTLRKTQPMHCADTETKVLDPILSRKIIHRPFTSMLQSYPSNEEAEMVHKKYVRYQQQREAQEAMNEIAQFEQRTMGKPVRPITLSMTPLDRGETRILELISPPNYTEFYDVYDTPGGGATTSMGSRVIQPAPWSILDDPMVPSRPTKRPEIPERKRRPFIDSVQREYNRGIPLMGHDLKKLHRQKIEKYNESVRYLQTIENQKKENEIKQRVQDNLESMRHKRDIESSMASRTGQDWVILAITKSQREARASKKGPKGFLISSDDMEALDDLKQRDKKMIDHIKGSVSGIPEDAL